MAKTPLQFRIEPVFVRRIKEIAKQDGRSVSQWIRLQMQKLLTSGEYQETETALRKVVKSS